MGKPLLIENIEEELDPVLDPVLERRVIKKGKSLIIQLADKEVRHLTLSAVLSVMMMSHADDACRDQSYSVMSR